MGRRISDNTLLVRWDEKQQDFKVWFPNKCDGGFIMGVFCNNQICEDCRKKIKFAGASRETLIEELESRGYDPKTLRFTIKKKSS